jgi:hypothetical protein
MPAVSTPRLGSHRSNPAGLAAQQRALEERQAELSRLEAQSRSFPVELDAARAAEAAAKAQLEAQRAGA